jgi:hypothetical protein
MAYYVHYAWPCGGTDCIQTVAYGHKIWNLELWVLFSPGIFKIVLVELGNYKVGLVI